MEGNVLSKSGVDQYKLSTHFVVGSRPRAGQSPCLITSLVGLPPHLDYPPRLWCCTGCMTRHYPLSGKLPSWHDLLWWQLVANLYFRWVVISKKRNYWSPQMKYLYEGTDFQYSAPFDIVWPDKLRTHKYDYWLISFE